MTWLEEPELPGGLPVSTLCVSGILETGCCGRIRSTGPKQTKLVYAPIFPDVKGFVPAPNDVLSFEQSLLKWKHPQGVMTLREFSTLVMWLDREFGQYLNFRLPTLDELLSELDPMKAAGYPYNDLWGPFKAGTIAHVSLEQLIIDFMTHDQIVEASRKDELRPPGKGSRIILGSNTATIVVGIILCHVANTDFLRARRRTASAVGMSSPGGEAYAFWHILADREGALYRQSDGAANDAHFSLLLAQAICELRKLHTPKQYHPLLERYYKAVYCFRASFLGYLHMLCGMQTGQYNTLVDNTIGNIAVRMLATMRAGGDFDAYKALGLSMVGDDGVESNIGIDLPVQVLDATHTSLFMYVEVPKDHESFFDLKFIGMHPVIRPYKGKSWLMYSYDVGKMLASANYLKRKMTVAQRFAKLVGLAGLVWGERDAWKLLQIAALSYYKQHAHLIDHETGTLLAMLSSRYQFRAHMSL